MAVLADTILDTTASVNVTMPTAAPTGGWPSYQLSLCTNGTGCTAQQNCTAAAGAAVTTCAITSLLPHTNYTIRVAGVKAGASTGTDSSLASSVDLLTRIS